MTELQIDDPCIVFALSRESQSFRKEFRPQQRFAGAPCWARFCGPAWLTVLVVHCGIGAANMGRAVQWLLEAPKLDNLPYRPKLILSAGFAGALQDGFAVGDVILATEIVDAGGQSWPATWPQQPLSGAWQPPIHRGRLLTTSKLVATPEEKRALGKQHDAVGVDMESAALAKECHRAGIPFGSLRAISDDVHTGLSPQLVQMLSGDRVSPWRIFTTLLRSPGMVPELLRLAKKTRFAGERLGVALGELLTLTLPWSAELERG